MDTNANDTKENFRGISELSKKLFGKSVYVRYLYATDLRMLANGKSNGSYSNSQRNVSVIPTIVQAFGTEKDNSSSKVEGLTTKSAFFVISETTLVHDMVTYVRHNCLENLNVNKRLTCQNNNSGVCKVLIINSLCILVFNYGIYERWCDVVCGLQRMCKY